MFWQKKKQHFFSLLIQLTDKLECVLGTGFCWPGHSIFICLLPWITISQTDKSYTTDATILLWLCHDHHHCRAATTSDQSKKNHRHHRHRGHMSRWAYMENLVFSVSIIIVLLINTIGGRITIKRGVFSCVASGTWDRTRNGFGYKQSHFFEYQVMKVKFILDVLLPIAILSRVLLVF